MSVRALERDKDIEAEYPDLVFCLFGRLARDADNTGVVLALVKRIIERRTANYVTSRRVRARRFRIPRLPGSC